MPRKGAQGEMGRYHPLLFHLARCRVLHEDDWGRVRYHTPRKALHTMLCEKEKREIRNGNEGTVVADTALSILFPL